MCGRFSLGADATTLAAQFNLFPAPAWTPRYNLIDSGTILTARPNALLRPLHHRMAVMLPHNVYPLWLDPRVQEVARLQPLLCPYPAKAMTAFPVGPRVNSPRTAAPAGAGSLDVKAALQ